MPDDFKGTEFRKNRMGHYTGLYEEQFAINRSLFSAIGAFSTYIRTQIFLKN
jgi:hypothetical protein